MPTTSCTGVENLRAAGMRGKWYTMHSARVRGARVDGTAMDVLMEYPGVEVRTRRTQIHI